MTAEPIDPPHAPAPPDGPGDEYEVPEHPEARTAFQILNDRMCNWAMRKLRKHSLRRRRIVAEADEEIERWMSWKSRQVAAVDHDIRFFEGILTHYLLTVRMDPEDGRKSIDTPYGVLKSKSTQPKWEINEEQLVPWLRTNRPQLLRVTTVVDVVAAKKFLPASDGTAFDPETGETIPGIAVAAPGITASISLDTTAP